MYQFTLNMWTMSRIGSTQVRDLGVRGYLTETEVEMILAV